jgi:Tfp pilus assembly protein FimT
MTRRTHGISVLELLIVLAIIGIVGGIGFLNGRRIATDQSAQGALATIQQSIWQGATAAASRGRDIELALQNGELSLQEADGTVLRSFELPDTVSTNLAAGAGQDGVALRFLPPGKVDLATLDALPDPITFQTSDATYRLSVSVIGEVIAEAAP